MLLAFSSFCDTFGAGLELLTSWCRLGLYLFFGLIGGNNGRFRRNIWLFLLGWAATIWSIRAICPIELHMSNPLSVRATLHRTPSQSSGSSSLAEVGLWRIKVNTDDETTAHKFKSLFGIRNTMLKNLLLADYIRDLTT